ARERVLDYRSVTRSSYNSIRANSGWRLNRENLRSSLLPCPEKQNEICPQRSQRGAKIFLLLWFFALFVGGCSEEKLMSPVKILVVDDEPDLELLVRQKFRRAIREKELEFSFAHNGLEALERLRADPQTDIVLTDINMPVMDGLALLSNIAEFDSTIKTIVVSAYSDMANIRTAMNRGAYDFLIKPIDFDDLTATITKTAEHAQMLKRAHKEHQQL